MLNNPFFKEGNYVRARCPSCGKDMLVQCMTGQYRGEYQECSIRIVRPTLAIEEKQNEIKV